MKTQRLRAFLLVCLAAVSISCGGGGGASNGGGSTSTTTSTPQALTITTASILPPTLQGHSYSASLAAANGQGALHWTIAPVSSTALFVTGLSIDANTGALSGTANFAGTGGFIATVTDSATPARSATGSFTITAFPPLVSAQNQTASVMEFQTPSLRTGIQGGVPPIGYTVTSGTMPPGWKFDNTGTVTGAAFATGAFQFTVTAQDSFSPPETATQPFTITITPAQFFVANSLPSRLVINEAFSGRVVAVGGAAPYKFSLSQSTSLPHGLSLDPNTGIVSGTPTQASTFFFTIQATDSSATPQSASAGFNVTVGPSLGRNDSPSTATAIDNGGFNASISPYIDPPNGAPLPGDNDYYKLVSAGGAVVHIETLAKRNNINNPLDTVIEIVDGNGVRLNTCRQPGDTTTTFAGSCINDDISATPHVQDSALDFQVPGASSTSTTFYVHVFDWRGDARPDMVYGLQVSGVIH